MQPFGTRPIPAINIIPGAYIQLLGIELTCGAYMQLLGSISTMYIQPSNTRPLLTDLGIRPISAVYTPLLGIGAILAASMQSSGTRPLSAAYKQPSDVTSGEYIKPSGPISAAYIQFSGTRLLLAAYALPGIGFISAAYSITAMLNTSISHGRKLLNLAKIYIDSAKYSGRNNIFTFKLAIFHDICSKSDVLPKAKIKVFFIMLKSLALDYYYSNISISGIVINFNQLCYLIRIRWIK